VRKGFILVQLFSFVISAYLCMLGVVGQSVYYLQLQTGTLGPPKVYRIIPNFFSLALGEVGTAIASVLILSISTIYLTRNFGRIVIPHPLLWLWVVSFQHFYLEDAILFAILTFAYLTKKEEHLVYLCGLMPFVHEFGIVFLLLLLLTRNRFHFFMGVLYAVYSFLVYHIGYAPLLFGTKTLGWTLLVWRDPVYWSNIFWWTPILILVGAIIGMWWFFGYRHLWYIFPIWVGTIFLLGMPSELVLFLPLWILVYRIRFNPADVRWFIRAVELQQRAKEFIRISPELREWLYEEV
jgi:hypothetical protein